MVDRTKVWVSWAALVGATLLAGEASAQVFQSDAAMTPLPQPVGENEFNLVTESWAYKRDTRVNRDYNGNDIYNDEMYFGDFYPDFVDGDAITLEGLFKWHGEAIDPVADARTDPGYFSPQCGFTGEMVLRGGDCQVAFGWYNVSDPNSTTPPADTEIYELIPQNISEFLNCQGPLNNGFCPLAWDNVDPRELDKVMWEPQVFSSGAIQEDPRYTGNYVGFAVIGNSGANCSASKYSIKGQNQKNASGDPWVTTIMYQSTVDPEGFYLAFEDLPMSTDDWRQTGVPGQNAQNDGDFNDFVFYVSGVGCEGGGEACDTGLLGACSLGRTDCAAEGQVGMCRPIINPGAELCDNVDNDCDGEVDEDEGLCPEGMACDQGVCVGACGGAEFPCNAGLVCNSKGVCIDELCADVTCEPGEACREGVCKSACDGVMCPAGQECQLGRCVDPCATVECPAGRVCERGLCLSDCACRGCDAGLECGSDGRCSDPACQDVMCPEGTSCQGGTCVDLCQDVVCPGGGQCINGTCTEPVNMPTTSGSGGTGIVIGDDGIPNPTGTTGANTGAGGTNGRGGLAEGRQGSDSGGCSCRIADSRSPSVPALLILLGGAGVAFARRRRRTGSGYPLAAKL